MIVRTVAALALASVACTWAGGASAQFDLEAAPFDYFDTQADEAVSRLQTRIDAGEVTLQFQPHFGYLPAVLRELKVPVASQTLVFSKTSLQAHLISPQSPRAIYFNDDVYVGWMPGGQIEASVVDSRLGTTFYLLEQTETPRPHFVRQRHDCLQCHASEMTGGVPGHVVRSVSVGPDGTPLTNGRSFLTTHSSPLRDRWGGWYVTGQHGSQQHLGNTLTYGNGLSGRADAGANKTSLGRHFNTLLHLSPHSDIVALMVLEHQTCMHNSLALAAFQARLAEHRAAGVEDGASAADRDTELEFAIRQAAASVVEHLLLASEAPLTDRIEGTSTFARKFARPAPHDSRGRSLRELDLGMRLFRFPCSYLIYSPAFQNLPPRLKQEVYRQLWDALQPEATAAASARLTQADRQAIREILHDTLPDLPKYWHATTTPDAG